MKARNIRIPILVLGLNGVPGYSLFRYFNKLFGGTDTFDGTSANIYSNGNREVYGIRPTKRPCVFGDNVFAIDAEETEKLGQLFEEYEFGSVIDASGNCALRACECDTELCRLLNYSQGVDAANFAAQYGCDLIRISTDMVFSGSDNRKEKRPYIETDPKDPIHNYGKHQSEAEDEIQRIKPDTVFLRIPLPMDYAPGGCAGAIDWISYRFRPGRPATLYVDEFRNPIYGIDMCRVCEYILTHEFPPGIYNCGGPRKVSLYNVGQIVNAVGGFNPELLIGCPRIEAGPLPPRVGDISTNSQKIYDLLPAGMIRPWPSRDDLVPTDFDWHKRFGRNTQSNVPSDTQGNTSGNTQNTNGNAQNGSVQNSIPEPMGSEEAIYKWLVLG